MTTAKSTAGQGPQGTVVQLERSERSEAVQPVALILMHIAMLMAAAPFFGVVSTLIVLAPLIGTAVGLVIHSPLLSVFRGKMLESDMASAVLIGIISILLWTHHFGLTYSLVGFGLMPIAGVFMILLSCLAIHKPTPSILSAMAGSVSMLLLLQLAINQGLMRSLYAGIVFFVVWASLASRRSPARQAGGKTGPKSGRLTRMASLVYGLRTAGWTLLVSVPLMVAFFVLFPRLPLDALRSERSESQTGSTGLSDSLTLGSIAELQKSDQPAFTATFRGKSPAGNSLYWRAVVLDRLEGQRWLSSEQGKGVAPDPAAANLMITTGAPMQYLALWDVSNRTQLVATLEGTTGRAYASFNENTVSMFMRTDGTYSLLQSPAAVAQRGFQIQSVVANAYEQARLNAPVATPAPTPAPVPADASVTAPAQAQQTESQEVPETTSPAQPDMSPWLALPANFNPRTQAFGRQLRQRMVSDERIIAEVHRMFGQDPYRYTLRPPALGQQAIDDFFLETRAGFCEHYASTFVVLMRAAGVPARLVTGYLSTGVRDGQVRVSQGDAHAWAEVWTPAGGWTRQDPTASISPLRVDSDATNARLEAAPAGFLGFLEVTWRRNTGRAEIFWRDTMLDFDAGSQERIFSKLGLDTIGKPLLAAVAILLMAGMAVAWQYLRSLISLGPRQGGAGSLERALERQARILGIVRQPWQTWRQAMNEAGSKLQGQGAQEFAVIVAEYEALTYGQTAWDAKIRVRTLKRRIRAFRPSSTELVRS